MMCYELGHDARVCGGAQFFHGTAPKPTYSQIHQAIFGFNSQDDVAPKALSANAPAPKH